MAPLRVSTTKSEWLPDDPTAFVPTRLWKLPFITTWDDSRNQNRPTDSAEEAQILDTGRTSPVQTGDPTVFETLFKYPRILARHRTGPFAEARERFLSYCALSL